MRLVVSINLSLVPEHDLIAPPLTSKLLKYCLDSRLPKKFFDSHSNVTYTQLSDGVRPLYSTGNSPVTLVRGSRYLGRVVVVSDDHKFVTSLEDRIRCSGAYGDYVILVNEIELCEMGSLTMNLERFFKIAFLTPTLLTVKLMSPPSLKNKVKRFPELHKLIPQPSFIFSYLLKLWNSYAEPEEKIPRPPYNEWAPYKLGRLADITITEVDYRLRPETVVIGKNDKGVLRKARGFIGWVIYESTAPRNLHDIYAKLLALATLTGVGRSRGIGLGQIQVINLSKTNAKSKNSHEFRRKNNQSI